MARTRVELDQIGWHELETGSLGGPGSFLGIDINGQPVLVAASDYVAAGGGSGISHDGSTADGVLTYKDSDEATVESNLTFDGSTLTVAGNIVTNEYIYHNGDADTYIRFEGDTITLAAGGRDFIKIEEASQDRLTINNGGLDLDFKVSGENNANLFRTDASNDLVCIATGSSLVGTDTNFHVSGTIGAKTAGDRGVSVFAGDVVVSGTLNVESQLTASNGIQISNVPTGSLAGPASFLGLDTGGRVIQVAASDYVSAGDSGDSFQVRLVGRFKISSTNTARHFTHTQGMSNAAGGDYNTQRTEAGTSDTSFTSTPRQALDYYAVSVAPYSCTLESVTNIAELRYKYSNSPAWRVWKGTYTNNSTGNVTWTEILPATSWTSGGSGTDQDDVMVYDRTTLSSDNSFNAGDLIGFTWQTGGSTASGFNSFIATMNFKGA